MFTAQEAHKKTNEAIANMQLKADRWVENEWEFIDAKIKEAIALGKYETSYWWSNELLRDAGIQKSYAAEALKKKALSLGFSREIWQNYSNNNVLRIELRWEKV